MRTIKVEEAGNYECWRDRSKPCSAKCMAFTVEEKHEYDSLPIPVDIASRIRESLKSIMDEKQATAAVVDLLTPWAAAAVAARDSVGWQLRHDDEIELTADMIVENRDNDDQTEGITLGLVRETHAEARCAATRY